MQLTENLVVAGRFRLNRLIGRGGMGSVWQATHLGLDIPCAVKFIEGEYANLAEAQARFEREAKAAAQLRSPHVVQILDHGVWENTPYIAMELLDGEDLGKRLQQIGVMAPDQVNTVIQQVCRALTKAHQAGIVHRDLKPDNIFLVRDDDREIVKVLDFGIAKKSTGQLDTGSNTKTGAMLGTPYYMSPEQAQGIKSVDARSDLWSLAVIVYQALTGKLPFESEALGDLLVKIIVAPIPVPSQVARVPPQFDRWWARAADRDPTRRFPTAKEFADSLALVLGQSAVTDVMDRAQINAAMAGTALMPPDAVPRGSLSGATPQPGMTPAMAMTPQPNDQPYRQTPGFGPPAVGALAGANTTGALASDFAGVAPKKGNGAVFAAVGVAAVLVLGIGAFALVGRSKPTAGTSPDHATTAAASAASPAQTAAPTPAPPPPAASDVPTPTAAASASAPPAVAPQSQTMSGSHRAPSTTPKSGGAAAGGGGTKPGASPTGAKKPAAADMGF